MIQRNNDRDRDADCMGMMEVEQIEQFQIDNESKCRIDGIVILPSNLFNLVCMCLNSKDIVNLMCTSRAINEKVLTQAQYALSTLALKLFFSNEIDGYVEYGYEEKYLICKSQRTKLIAEYMKHNIIQLLQKYSKLRSSIQQTAQIAELDLIFVDILNPPMPVMKIRRENVGMHAHSWFQHKLVDVYCDNQANTSKNLNSFHFVNSTFKKPGQTVVPSQIASGTLSSNSLFASSSTSLPLGTSSSQQSSFTSQAKKSIGLFNNHYGAQQKKLKFFSERVSENQQKLISYKQMKQNSNSSSLHAQSSHSQQTMEANYFQDFEEQNLPQISTEQLEQLLDSIRWYREFDEISLIGDTQNPQLQRYISENEVVFTVLLVSAIFKNQCCLFYEYLEQNSNHATYFDLISEYNLKWNIYQAAVIEAQENLEEVYRTFNDVYQAEVGVKMYPQYSLLRVTAQHWSRIVLQPLKDKLFDAFFALLQNRRLENLRYIFTGDQQQLDPKLISIYYMPEKLDHIPIDLTQRFQRLTVQNSMNSNKYSCQYNKSSCDKMHQEFFSKNSYFVDNILVIFCENMMDLSVNEASVHWLGHTDMQVGSIYADLHKYFLERTQSYYDELYNQVFSGHVMEWKQFLMGELKYCRKIVKEQTFKQTNKLVLDTFFTTFSKEMNNTFGQIPNHQEILYPIRDEQANLRIKLQSKGVSQQAWMSVMNEQRWKKQLDTFERMKDEEDEFNSKSVRDEDIEDINRYRQIKQKLDQDSFSFYDLVGNIDQALIQKTKNIIRSKLAKQNPNLQKQSNLHSHSHKNHYHFHNNYDNLQSINHSHSHGHNHNHNILLNATNPFHQNGSSFVALSNTNNTTNFHNHHNFLQQGQQTFQLSNLQQQQQQQQQNHYSQQIDEILLFSQNFLVNDTNNNTLNNNQNINNNNNNSNNNNNNPNI